MKMKQLLTTVFAFLALTSCSDEKAQEKTLLDSVIKVHDAVMGADEQLMKNKILLDSVAKSDSAASARDSVFFYLKKLNNADSAMSDWMHKFDPETTGKPHSEIMVYLNSQKKQIEAVNNQVKTAIASTNEYLTKHKLK
jgi:uncharacterized protein YcgL (UPF0745 family)